jgi:uncharacterized membrane protein YjfL (UPF0719 family)
VKFDQLLQSLLSTSCFVALGIVMFGLVFWIITKVAPFSIKKEIAEDQNTALAILIASVIIGISLIISAGIHS